MNRVDEQVSETSSNKRVKTRATLLSSEDIERLRRQENLLHYRMIFELFKDGRFVELKISKS